MQEEIPTQNLNNQGGEQPAIPSNNPLTKSLIVLLLVLVVVGIGSGAYFLIKKSPTSPVSPRVSMSWNTYTRYISRNDPYGRKLFTIEYPESWKADEFASGVYFYDPKLLSSEQLKDPGNRERIGGVIEISFKELLASFQNPDIPIQELAEATIGVLPELRQITNVTTMKVNGLRAAQVSMDEPKSSRKPFRYILIIDDRSSQKLLHAAYFFLLRYPEGQKDPGYDVIFDHTISSFRPTKLQ